MNVHSFIHQILYDMKNWFGDYVSVLAFYVTMALPYDGHNYRPKHVVNVMTKWIYSHL
jgi:hypothetical protein